MNTVSIEIISYIFKRNLCASITLSITLSNVHLRLEDFPKKDLKVVVLFYTPVLTIVNLRFLR